MSNPLSNKYLYCAYCRYTCTVQMHMEEHMNKCKNVRLVKMQTYSKNKKSTPNTLKTTIVAAPSNLVPSQQVDSHSRIMNRLLLYLIRKNPVTVGETSSLFSAIPNRTSGIYLQPNNTTEKHQSKESTHVIILSDDETPIEPVNKVYEEPNNLVIVNEDAKMDKELVKQLDIDSLAVDTENKRAGNECNDVNMQIGSRNEAKRLSDSNTNIVSNLLLPSCQKTNNAIRMMSVENYLYKNGQIENEFNAVNVQMGSSNEAERLSDSNINNVSNLLFKSCQNSNNAIGLVSLENDDPCKNGEITDTKISNVAPAESTTHDADTNKITTTTDTEINSVMKDLASVLTDSSLNNETTENTNNLNRDLPWQNSVVVCSCGSRVTEVCHSIIEINEGSKCNIKNFPGDLNKLPMSEKSIAKDKVVISGDHSLMNIQIQKTVASSKLALNTQNCSGDLNKLPMSETSIAKDKATSEDTTLIDIQKTSTSSKLIRQLLTDKRCVFLADHLVDQKILTIYKCDSCNFNTRYLKLLDSHIIDHFCQMANSKYTCNKCRAHLSDKRDVIEHVKKLQHGYTIGVWCVNCSSIFLKTWEARKHQKVCPRKQISVKLFRSNNVIFCMLCQYETSDLAQAKEHTKIHKERVMNTRQVIEVD